MPSLCYNLIMLAETVTLSIPEALYQRLASTARAMQRPLEDVLLHALRVGSPPAWEDVPAEFQADLAQLDRLADSSLWQIARSRKSADEVARHDELLALNQAGALTDAERLELQHLHAEADRFMLRKAHAAALLRWRGHIVPTP
jgi:hypothetical protein